MNPTTPTRGPIEQAQLMRDLDDLDSLIAMFAEPDDDSDGDEPGVWVPYANAIDLAQLLERCREALASIQ